MFSNVAKMLRNNKIKRSIYNKCAHSFFSTFKFEREELFRIGVIYFKLLLKFFISVIKIKVSIWKKWKVSGKIWSSFWRFFVVELLNLKEDKKRISKKSDNFFVSCYYFSSPFCVRITMPFLLIFFIGITNIVALKD